MYGEDGLFSCAILLDEVIVTGAVAPGGTGGDPPVVGDRIEFTPISPTSLPAFVTQLDVTASDVPSIELTGAFIGQFNNSHAASGEALVSGNKSEVKNLVVSNLGSSGQDGISISTAAVDSFDITFDPIDETGMAPTGAQIAVEAFGTVSGQAYQDLGIIELTKSASASIEVAVDFNSIGSPTHHVQVFNNGTLVADFPGHSGLAATVDHWPYKIGKLGGTTECFVCCHDGDVLFSIDSSSFVGDELRVLAEGTASAVQDKTEFLVTAKELESLTIIGESGRQLLTAVPAGLSLTTGGTQVLTLDAGTEFAGDLYLVAGSASGTSPGFAFGGVVVPLNPDDHFFATLASPLIPPFSGLLGILDSAGQGAAQITAPPGTSASLAGIVLHHAYLALDTSTLEIGLVSPALPLSLLP